MEDDSFGENVISMVYRKGYRIGDRIVRHATVVSQIKSVTFWLFAILIRDFIRIISFGGKLSWQKQLVSDL